MENQTIEDRVKSLEDKVKGLTEVCERMVSLAEKLLGVNRSECDKPPEGWYCTREKGHEGPCVAWPKRRTEPINRCPVSFPHQPHDYCDGSSAQERAQREVCRHDIPSMAAQEAAEKGRKRTVAQVLRSRANPGGGCCNRYADNMACDCLEEAIYDESMPCGDQWKCDVCGTCNAGKAAKCMGCGE